MPSNADKARRRRAEENKALLTLVPEGTERIQVRDEKGKVRWRNIDQLADKDIIQTKKDGTPVVMMGRPGRREVNSKIGAANPVVAKLLEKKKASLREDELLNLVRTEPESADVLQQIMVGLAEEAGSIAFERREAERQGEPTSQLSTRRVNTLKAVADTWLKRKDQLVTQGIDMDSPVFGALMRFVMETFRGALVDANVGNDHIKVVFARIAKKVDSEEWRTEARNRMKRSV